MIPDDVDDYGNNDDINCTNSIIRLRLITTNESILKIDVSINTEFFENQFDTSLYNTDGIIIYAISRNYVLITYLCGNNSGTLNNTRYNVCGTIID
ncbi:7529_t:CDS:2, partial [Diversispora eburnea]